MGSKGQSTSTTSQNQTYTPTGSGYITDALNRAGSAANQPFNIPQAPVAGFSQDQQNAFNTVNNAQGMAQPYINQAQNYFSPQGAQSFFNPAVGAVTAQMQNIFGQQNQQNTANLTQAAGGVGADRIAVGQGNLANQQGLAAGQTYSNLWNSAVQQAQGAGYGTAALGSQAQNAALQGAQAQLGTGGLQQQLSQAQMNSPYQQQLAQAAFPYQQAQFLAGITGSLAPGLGGTTQGTGTTNTTPAQPSIWSQILGGGTALAGAAGGLGGKGSAPSWGGGSATSGDAYGGSSSNPLPGLTSGDYGFGYAEGGATSDEPIDIAPKQIIPSVQSPSIQPHIPQLNLNPPPAASGSGGGGSSAGDIAKMGLQIAGMFMKRGGSVNPFAGYAEGGAPEMSDADQAAMMPETYANPLVKQRMSDLASLPQRALQAGAQDFEHRGEEGYDPQSIAPAMETAMRMVGTGAPFAQRGALGTSGGKPFAFPEGYYDKVPMDMRLSRKGVSHPGIRWEVYDPKTGAVVRKDLQTRSGASLAQDRLDNKYGGYRYQVRPTRAGQMTEDEAAFLKDKGIEFKRGGSVNPFAFADGGTPSPLDEAQWPYGPEGGPSALDAAQWPSGPVGGPSDVINFGDPIRRDPGADDNWRAGANADRANGLTATDASSNPFRSLAAKAGAPAPAAAQAADAGASAPAGASGAGDPEPPARDTGFAGSPWAALMAAGLGTMAGTSPFAGVNIGQGGLQGLKTLEQQRSMSQKDETIDQAAKRLALEAKHHEDQYTRSTPYQQFEMSKPFAMGQRIDALTGQSVTTFGTRQPDGSIRPVDPTAAPANPAQAAADDATLPANAKAAEGFLIPGKNVPDNVDPSVLAGQDPGVANMVRSIDEGRSSLSQVPMKQRFMVERLLHAYDGGWDQTLWRLRNDQQADLSTKGNAGKMILAVNQLLPHLKKASDDAQELQNSSYPAANTVKNWWLTFKGDPRVKKFAQVREVAAMDAARLLRGSGQMAEKDIDFWRENISAADSPQTMQGLLHQLADDLMGARIDSIKQSYRMNMRQEPPDFVSQGAKDALAVIKSRQGGGAPAAGSAADANAAAAGSAAPAASPAEQPPTPGARKAPDGHWYVQQNGKYFRVDQ